MKPGETLMIRPISLDVPLKSLAVEPGTHGPTIVGTSILDYALTIALAIVVTKVTNVPLVLTTSACMMLSVGVHAAFGVDTATVLWIKDLGS